MTAGCKVLYFTYCAYDYINIYKIYKYAIMSKDYKIIREERL